MTKKIKQILGVVMAAMLCFALTPTAAFAASGTNGNTGTITINNAVVDKEYKAYQIMKLESYNYADEAPEAGAYSYVPVDALWNTWLSTGAGSEWVTVSAPQGGNEFGYVTWKSVDDEDAVVKDRRAAEFAAAAIAYAKEHSIAASATTTATAGSNGEAVAQFTGLNLGYYLVDSNVGVLCSLATTNPNATITEKNGVPQVDKFVQEDSQKDALDGGWGKINDATIGERVNFKSIITVEPGTSAYVFNDVMLSGLTFDEFSVKINGQEVDPVSQSPDYVYSFSHNATGDSFTINFNNHAVWAQLEQITIEYSAVLNENAVVGSEGNKNSCTLSYSNGDETIATPPSETTTYSWQLEVFKHNESGDALAGAKFTLAYNDELLKFVRVGETNEYKVAPTTGTLTEIETDSTGRFTISGLDEDTYSLTETVAPNGYNKLAGPIEVKVGSEKNEDGIASITLQDVVNKTGSFLPSTGGMGTTILYVVGGVLVIGAIIFLVRRRSSATK